MDRERWQRIEEIFHAALERPDLERLAFLENACRGDLGLRDEVAALLAHDDPDASFMETPVLGRPGESNGGRVRVAPGGETAEATCLSDTPRDASHPEELPPGHQIQNYRIVQKIGAGGMGDVYLAEDLQLGRRVALKLLPPSIRGDARGSRRFLREARAASALNHPNIVTIYSVKESDGFIDMEYVDGESLRERLLRGPLSLTEVISLGLEAADAMSAAHAINIVHRDLKPGNILFNSSGQTKIVDFGLAKMAGAAAGGAGVVEDVPPGLSSISLSQVGSISGTVPYMSPEQTRGEHVDARSDIFSLGCVLYEAATGRRPFDGDHPAEIIQKIRDTDPPRPGTVRAGLPRALDAVILRALAKDKTQRFSSAGELASALRRLRTAQRVRHIARRVWLPASALLILILISTLWFNWRRGKLDWAQQCIPQVQQLVDEYRFFEAHDLAEQIAVYVRDDPKLENLKPWLTDVLSVTTDPPQARVYLQRFQLDSSGGFPVREFIGTTPFHDLEIARGDYLLSIEKDGYVTFQRTLSNALNRMENGLWNEGMLREAELVKDEFGRYTFRLDSKAPLRIDVTLLETASAPDGMVFVPGGQYRLVGGGRPTQQTVELDDFFIDQFEVTNREYKQFVDAGGYDDRRYWKLPFLRHDPERGTTGELSWEEGMALLRDRSGDPGPRSWSHQQFPEGKDDFPVTDVSWYEAAAYAEFRGKQLPTIFQWEKAARNGQWTHLWGSVWPWGLVINEAMTDRANVNGTGTMPVGSYPFGLSPFGCYDMVGNVWEWCANPRPRGFTRAGGSWLEGPYLFRSYGDFPGFFSADNLGFRCVRNSPDADGDQGGMPLPDSDEVPHPPPLSEDAYRLMRTFYEYDHKDLDVEVLDQVPTDGWRRLKVRFIGAYGQRAEHVRAVPENKRALAYLWLPANTNPPYQVVNYKPGAASYEGVTVPQEVEIVCRPFLDSGRAVFVTLLEGMRERDLPPDWREPEVDTVAYRDMLVHDTLDQRIGLDYLTSRGDIDMEKIACMGLSMGGYDLVTMAVEDRFHSVLLLSAGLGRNKRRIIDAADPVNFAPYISGPKLMIHGRYDEGQSLETHALPLFEMLSEPKELVVLESGHFPPMAEWVPHALRFLDTTLGPVEMTDNSSNVAQRRP